MWFYRGYTGWSPNTLYLNTYSDNGVSKPTFDNLEINAVETRINSDLRVKHTAYTPNIRGVNQMTMGDAFGTSVIGVGNGDGASHATHNLVIRSWWGIGFRNNSDECTVVMNTRTGDIEAKGLIAADFGMRIGGKNLRIQWEDPGDIGEGGIWIRS